MRDATGYRAWLARFEARVLAEKERWPEWMKQSAREYDERLRLAALPTEDTR